MLFTKMKNKNLYLNDQIFVCMSWVCKMVIPVYGVSEGEALSDWIY